MKISFRVDATQKIGTGHLMRCLTLAHELAKRGAEIEFICRKLVDHLAELILSKSYKLCILHTNSVNEDYCPHATWLEAHWQEDATQTLLKVKGTDWLIVDHYALDEKWESILHPYIDRIMVIDDVADRRHKCDLLLDQNYYTDAATRYADLVDKDCQLLLEPKYALLREEFAFKRASLNRVYKSVDKILLFFGGVDANNDIGKALAGLMNFKGEVIIVAGSANENYPELEQICITKDNFTLLKSTDNMAKLMTQVDLAIGGGGATSWERATLGLPALAWPIADNQVRLLNDLDKYGAIKLTSPEKLEADLNALNSRVLKQMSQKAMQLCDAEGATRVANKLWSFNE